LDVSEVKLTNKTISVRYFLMEMMMQQPPREKRRMGWFPYREAVAIISHDANRELLIKAEEMRAAHNW
jgi:hypothetical protein